MVSLVFLAFKRFQASLVTLSISGQRTVTCQIYLYRRVRILYYAALFIQNTDGYKERSLPSAWIIFLSVSIPAGKLFRQF